MLRVCVRKRQVSIKKLVKHYCANVVELIFKIAGFLVSVYTLSFDKARENPELIIQPLCYTKIIQ